MKITAFDDLYSKDLASGLSTLSFSSGSNSADGDLSGGGDVVGSPGDYTVVGLRDAVALASNLASGVAIGDVLTIIQAGADPIARFATPSNTGSTSGIYYNVVDYGAVGDDTTDDTTAIQDACDAATAAGGGTVYLPHPPSKYKITAAIEPGLATLLGDGGATARSGAGTIIRQATSNTNGILCGTPGGSYPTKIEGIKIEGPTGNSSGAAITIGDSPSGGDFDLIDVFTDGFYYGAKWGAQSYFSKAYHCRFSNADTAGVYLKSGANNTHFYGCRWDHSPIGVDLIGHLSVGFFGGNFDPYDVTVAQIRANGAASGNNAGLVVSGMYIETDDGVPDILLGDSAQIRQVLIEGTTFVKSGYSGTGWHVDGQNVVGLTVLGCEFMSTSAVRATGSSSDVVLLNNTNRNSGTITIPSGSILIDTTSTTPSAIGTAAAGTSSRVARVDHVHAADAADVTFTSGAGLTSTNVADAIDEVAASGGSGAGQLLISSSPSNPIVFGDVILKSDGTDFLYSST